MKRKAFLLSAVITASFFIASAQQVAKITPSGIGYLEYLPDGYHSNSNDYPVVISLHGVKEKGTSSTNERQVLNDLPRVAKVGLPRYVKSGKKYPFILISPQLKNQYGSWPPSFVMEVLNHVRKTLRIDEKRIYLTGLSLGGFGVWKTAGEYPEVFAAIVPICAGGNSLDKANAIAKQDVAAWGFHGDNDRIVSYTVTTKMVNAINSAPDKPNPLAKVTIFPGMGHIIWDKAYQETNVIDWMLSFRNGSGRTTQSSNTNKQPVANAGPDKTVTLPTHSLTLEGKASDADGRITGVEWTKVSGGHASLVNASSEMLQLSDLSEGTYVFRFSVKDNDGASASDEVKVIVKGSANKGPEVSAGSDRVVILPANSVNLEGTASDTDGEITAVKWTKVSGGASDLNGVNTKDLIATNLVVGTYVFRFTVEDNDGAVTFDDVTVTVRENESQNIPPQVNAGADRSLTLPHNALSLRGNATDQDGSIVSYQWTQISGEAARANGISSQTVDISNLKAGSYAFRLTVKDNDGATSFDDVRIQVRAQSSQSSGSNKNSSAENSNDILPQDYEGPDRNNGEGIDYIPLDGQRWITGN